MLSGAGGDDIFSGYRRHAALYMERYWSWLPQTVRHLVQSGANLLPTGWPPCRKIRKLLGNASLDKEKRLAVYFFWLNQKRVKTLLTNETLHTLGEYNSFAPMDNHLTNIPNVKNPLNRMLYLECKTFLPDHNLNYTDKMSMAHCIEVRVPLLDTDLVRLCGRISPHLKQNAMTGKYIFKKAMEAFLPHEVIYRPKAAIPGPLRIWLKNDLREMVRDVLSPVRVKRRGWFDHNAVQKLIEDNESAKIDAAYSIWAMVSMEIWASLFLDRSYTLCD